MKPVTIEDAVAVDKKMVVEFYDDYLVIQSISDQDTITVLLDSTGVKRLRVACDEFLRRKP